MISTTRAKEILDSSASKDIIVLGDVMLDEYVWGTVSRVSPEAPVLVVAANSHTYVPGGSANVAQNVAAYGAVAIVCGIVGDDASGATLRKTLKDHGAEVDGLVTAPQRPTTLKTRVMAHSQQVSQQVVRVDHESQAPLDGDTLSKVVAYLEAVIPNCDAILLSDYQKGLLVHSLVQTVVNIARRHHKVITGNIKPVGIAEHCRLTMLTLNVYEASEASGIVLGDGSDPFESRLHQAGRILLEKSGSENVLITRSSHGLTLFSRDEPPVTIPAYPVEVFDGTGAGDTVITTLTLALAAGATALEAVHLANCAGAIVVRKMGVATASPDEIVSLIADHS